MKNKKYYYDLVAFLEHNNKGCYITVGEILYRAMENARTYLTNSKRTVSNTKKALDALPKDGSHSDKRHVLKVQLKTYSELCKSNKQKFKAYRELYNKWIKFTRSDPIFDNSALMSLFGFDEVDGTPKERYWNHDDDEV